MKPRPTSESYDRCRSKESLVFTVILLRVFGFGHANDTCLASSGRVSVTTATAEGGGGRKLI